MKQIDDTELEKMMNDTDRQILLKIAHGETPPGFADDFKPEPEED